MSEPRSGTAKPIFDALADLLESHGWRYRRGVPPRCWQDPLNPNGELVGMEAAFSRELRRERKPGEEFDRAVLREGLFS